MSEQPPKATRRKRSSRRPYAIAVTLVGLVITMAWLARGTIQLVGSGTDAPDFTAANLDGGSVRLSDYRGRVVLVNVWATWCVPCRKEMPSMERLYTKIRGMPGGDDFEILAVSIDSPAGVKDVREFMRELALTFPILHDPSSTVMDLYDMIAVPESFVIDRNGMIVLRRAADQEWDSPQFVDQITRLLDRPQQGD